MPYSADNAGDRRGGGRAPATYRPAAVLDDIPARVDSLDLPADVRPSFSSEHDRRLGRHPGQPGCQFLTPAPT
jgi:hypothetical protein